MRQRQAALIVAAMTIVLAALLVPLARLVLVSAADRAVGAATDKARNLEFLVATVARADLDAAVGQANSELPQYPATVYLPDGTTIGKAAPRTPAVELASRGSSFTAAGDGGWEVVAPVVASGYDGTAVVRVFVSDAERLRGVHRAWLILTLLGVGALIVAVLAGDWLTRSTVRPIRELAAVSHRLATGDLEARSRLHGPAEIREVASGLNHLAGRIQNLLRQERESVADISHRLRTPLTALRLEVEATPGTAAIAEHVATLEAAVTRVIEQIRQSDAPPDATCDATRIVTARHEFWRALAEDEGREGSLAVPEHPLPVGVPGLDLQATVDALLGNVFSHTPQGTAYRVALAGRPGEGARLVVEDAGPGFPGAEALRRGASGAGSTGLGLDIARRTARASGGELTIGASDSGGARVVVDFGPPRGPRPKRA